MSQTATVDAAPTGPGAPGPGAPGPLGITLHTFFAVLSRDVFVTGRELGPFLVQTLLQPFFILFILGKVLVDLSYAGPKFADILLPGIVALVGFITALQNTTLPIMVEFSWTMEIEDRLLAPMPIWLVAVEKMVFGAVRGLIAALVMVPIGFLILHNPFWPVHALPAAAGVLVLGSLMGATIGMTVGTLVSPRQIQLLFAVIMVPLSYTGSAQFPWRQLGALRWFQVVCALNPLTYVSESMRSLLLNGEVPSIPLWINLLVIIGCLGGFGYAGIRGFVRRARN